MLGFIIFGTRGVTYTAESGTFHCPQCRVEQSFKQKRVRRFFTLYFIPVIPLDMLGEYVECQQCDGTYNLEVLEWNPKADAAKFEAEYNRAVKQVMILMMLADGKVDDAEVSAISGIAEKITGVPLPEDEVRQMALDAERSHLGVRDYLETVSPSLNDSGKEMVLKAALMIAWSDGEFPEEEQQLIAEVGQALQMSSAHVAGVMQTMSDPDDEETASDQANA